MAHHQAHVTDVNSDVSDLDQKELSEALAIDKWAPQLGYCEDPEEPLTADTFPSKSGGKPVRLPTVHEDGLNLTSPDFFRRGCIRSISSPLSK